MRLRLLSLFALLFLPQVADQIAIDQPFGLAVDYVNDASAPASQIVLFQNGTFVRTAPAPTKGTVQFDYPQGLAKGLYNFRIVARSAAGLESAEPNPTLALTVGDVVLPPPQTAIEFETMSCNWIVKTLAAPDTSSGWSIQFRETLPDGTFKNLGSVDSTVPYRRQTGAMSGGPHVVSGVWKKNGEANVVLPSVTRVCQ